MTGLHETCEARKAEVKKLLRELDELRKKAARDLSRTGGLSRRLSAYHRREMGFFRVRGGGRRPAEPAVSMPLTGGGSALLEPVPPPAPALQWANRRELKVRELNLLSIIDQLKKTLLQLDILELRCRELLVSIAKAREAFVHEFKIVKRKLYPFGIFSRLRKSFRRLWSGVYYTPGDLRTLAVLGALTVHIIDMAEAPVA
jgi:hypothetical protein